MMQTVNTIVISTLTLALLLAFYRLVRGPSLPDRVVALDLISMIIAGMLTASVIRTRQPVLLDTVTVIAVVSFFGTIAFARYLERRSRSDE
ncbi:monovalent cation/H+ antiporter complex subunit F [Gemmatimonas sp.]|uniref:monovalent cation/H+ antiporter complex subunit F n=1 Tax=Gemmatimonas sp. TaxID=1962908 RepID=UPI00356954C5